MKMLAISGSPRGGGNTELLLNVALDECRKNGWDIAEFYLSNRSIKPCIGCETCQKEKKCLIIDDDMGEFVKLIAACDAVLIGTPVYYRNVTAQLKSLFDRTHGYESLGLFKRKPGGALAVGRGEGGGQSFALSVIHNFLLSCGSVCVPGELNGVSARADKPGDILRQERRLEQARILARNVMHCAEKLSLIVEAREL